MGLFRDRIKNTNGKTQVPVWFMRQAGRYHDHYQNIKKNSDFMTMCKNPKLAWEVTHGPLDEFDFDAAILFSDLLFPLEHLGMDLIYNPGPILGTKLESTDMLKTLRPVQNAQEFFNFQKEACTLLRESMPKTKTLLGFVGAPWTLYTYAVEGSHAGSLTNSKNGIYDGRFQGFLDILIPELLVEMSVQAQGGADAICLFDTAAGELTREDYKKYLIPALKKVTSEFKKIHPDKKVIYYSKLTHIEYLTDIEDDNIDVLGVDWRMDITKAIKTLGNDYYIQGNLDPSHLHLPWNLLEEKWMELWQKIQASERPDRWIAGLGHGVLQHTPKENVKKSVALIHERFVY